MKKKLQEIKQKAKGNPVEEKDEEEEGTEMKDLTVKTDARTEEELQKLQARQTDIV